MAGSLNGAHTMLEVAKQVCPTTTRRLLGEGALLVDVRERVEVAPGCCGSTAYAAPARTGCS